MPNYIIKNIRELLNKGFSADELRRICYDTPEFRQVYDQLSPDTGKAQIIDKLIEYAEQKQQIETLLNAAKEQNSSQYSSHEPYYTDRPDPEKKPDPAPQTTVESPTTSHTPVSPQPRWRLIPTPLLIGGGVILLLMGLVVIGIFLLKGSLSPVEIATPTPLNTPTPGSGGVTAEDQPQPKFEIAALDTLEDDPNAYEVTDHLIWNQKPEELAAYGVAITFTIEVRPTYNGSEHFGKVLALISGDSGQTIEKPLWTEDFTSAANTQSIELSLEEILRVSALKTESDSASNPFQADSLALSQARLTVQIVRAADKTHPLASQELIIRNAPWDVRAVLVWNEGRLQTHTWVKNLGGSGEFALRYRVARLNQEVDTHPNPEVNGATTLADWFEPEKFIRLEQGGSFTRTTFLPNQTQPGRYLLEVYAIKKQNYIHFNDGSGWSTPNSLKAPWWFGEYPSQRLLFVIPMPKYDVNPLIQAEVDRLKNEQGIDLGLPTGIAEEETSGIQTKGWRQAFQQGEVYLYKDRAYALYGPILEHYHKLGGTQYEMGFPISAMEVITSSSGITVTLMKFEGLHTQPPGIIYASACAAAGTWGKIGELYAQLGGPAGWLGLPLADGSNYTHSTSQMFEYGYIVYYYPATSGGPDWSRPPIAYPYLTSRGTLFDVQAQSWQDTGVQVKPGDRITIVQVDGTWTYRDGVEPFDANGTNSLVLQADAILPTELVGTLIGRIGESSDYIFSVGRWKEFQAPAEGYLYLAMNDNGYGDNTGFITVQIMVEPAK